MTCRQNPAFATRFLDVSPPGRQAASRYLKALVAAGVLREQAFGKEKLFVHPRLMNLLTRDSNAFAPYPRKPG